MNREFPRDFRLVVILDPQFDEDFIIKGSDGVNLRWLFADLPKRWMNSAAWLLPTKRIPA